MLQYCNMQYNAAVGSSLSTTSYAVLGMLSLSSWTPYELTQQMRRSLVYCWPTSERALYSEPERLVAAGLARVETVEAASRRRRSYSITDTGRDALREWLRTTPAPVRIVNEPLLRLLFADQGGREDLLASLESLRASVTAQHVAGIEQVRPYLAGEGPFENRAHLVAMFADLYGRLFDAFEHWAAEAMEEVESWPTTIDLGLTDKARSQIEHVVNG